MAILNQIAQMPQVNMGFAPPQQGVAPAHPAVINPKQAQQQGGIGGLGAMLQNPEQLAKLMAMFAGG